jgi:uncharacterized membrane protein YphA (DoxX/SURF4 family)
MKDKILFVFALLFGLMFINSGLNKFFNYMPVPEELPEALMKDFQAIMEISWLYPLIGIIEIIGGILVIIPKTRVVGALVILPLMVGILATHFTVAPKGLIIAIVLAIVLAWIMFENRHKYRALFN